MLKIPYGLANYRNLIKGGYFYLDRTAYIQQLEDYSSLYPIFLRPRRFGKTLFINMLACYYGIQYKDEFQQLFGH
jgi:Predicted AAA-ATPase